jgi:hypothetical protein
MHLADSYRFFLARSLWIVKIKGSVRRTKLKIKGIAVYEDFFRFAIALRRFETQ